MKKRVFKAIKIIIAIVVVVIAIKAYSHYTQPKTRSDHYTIKNYDKPRSNTSSNENYNTQNNRNNKTYCNLPSSETIKYLTTSNFTLNGNGYVKFDTKYNLSTGAKQPSRFIVSGGGYRLEGDWYLSTNGRIAIADYRVVSGSFDASNNSKSRGSLNIECNGNLKGILVDYNGNNTDLFIKRSN
ncbi:hypothetical protein [Lacinutrix sp. MedPE-SW]|uniref:hypothetical protein n=1 Tax=Lacinutrix sp. MedPE-SW TaxID=1860087 RepID=UPI000913A2B4|nr:hypothetical protein [Lacinutrix sp. MedPE-SW]OIQ21197.1 MAG: hypothetical protein BM549_09485 [Lacinutrix sp. MedPE-SW]